MAKDAPGRWRIPDLIGGRLVTKLGRQAPARTERLPKLRAPRRGAPGAGLGLAICRRLAILMGGHIEAHGAPGQGARFVVSLTLPRRERAAAQKKN